MHECPRKEVTFCCITDPPTVILVSVRHGDVFWQRFCDVPGISFLFLSLFFNWYFSLWKAGTPWPRQHNQCSSWLRGRGREGEGIRGLSYLISVSTRASVWCKKSRCFFFSPSFTTLLHFFSFSHSEVCESLVLPVTLSILFRSSSALKMWIFHFPWNEIRILGVLGWITCLVWQPWPHKGSCFFFFKGAEQHLTLTSFISPQLNFSLQTSRCLSTYSTA